MVSSIIIIIIYYIYKYRHNLVSPFGVAHMYMCLGLIFLDWLTYQRVCPQRKLSVPPSAAIDFL